MGRSTYKMRYVKLPPSPAQVAEYNHAQVIENKGGRWGYRIHPQCKELGGPKAPCQNIQPEFWGKGFKYYFSYGGWDRGGGAFMIENSQSDLYEDAPVASVMTRRAFLGCFSIRGVIRGLAWLLGLSRASRREKEVERYD